jgi:cbb3-type cytochrome oxidase subunit 3
MEQTAFMIRKPVFFLMSGAILFLCFIAGFLYTEKKSFQQENRQLIIENDSIMSVNIVLVDSLKQKALLPVQKNLSVVFKSGVK